MQLPSQLVHASIKRQERFTKRWITSAGYPSLVDGLTGAVDGVGYPGSMDLQQRDDVLTVMTLVQFHAAHFHSHYQIPSLPPQADVIPLLRLTIFLINEEFIITSNRFLLLIIRRRWPLAKCLEQQKNRES